MKRSFQLLSAGLLAAAAVFDASAGKVVPVSMKVLESDMTGQFSKVTDAMGRKCALVKVKIPYKGATFDGVIQDEYTGSEYNVFIEDGNKYFKISFPGCEGVMVSVPELLGARLTAPRTYELVIDIPQLEYDPASEGVQTVMFNVSPVLDQPVYVEMDGQRSMLTDGEAKLNVLPGKYVYKVTAAGYNPASGTLDVQAGAVNAVNLSLRPAGSSEVLTFTAAGQTFDMLPVVGGAFTMGTNDSQAFNREKPAHSVQVDGFYIGETEVTQGLWKAVMGNNPSAFQLGDDYPVDNVSWDDCMSFIAKLNQLTGRNFRLPTEAEWEYAAKGGNHGSGNNYAGSENLERVGWYADNAGSTTHPVRAKLANELGIYDMSGNVWEWCSDWFDTNYYKNSPSVNPHNTTQALHRVYRGGGWNSSVRDSRITGRHDFKPALRHSSIGLRLVLPEVPATAPVPEPEMPVEATE